MKYTTREIALIGILSGMNGAIEITLGNYLHALQFFFTGNIMVGLNICIYMLARKSVDKRGTILIIGFITAFIKLLLGYHLNAALFIFFESLIVEIIISITGFNLAGTIIGSMSVNLMLIFYKAAIVWVMGGHNSFTMIIEFISKFANYFNINKELIFLPLILLILIYSLWGIAFGLLSWRLTNSFILSNKTSLS
jgi:hypothetical protein